MYQLEFSHVSYAQEGRPILQDLSFGVNGGESITIVGSSGSGKSTILRLCSHLVSPTEGDIYFHGQPLKTYTPHAYRQKVAYCMQQPYLFGSTIMGNIRFPFKIRGLPLDEKRVKALFQLFQMDLDILERPKDSISGGEMQRICLVRSLLFLPEILLLDEVTSALDEENTAIVESALQSLHGEGLTILFVTHNEKQSQRMGEKRMTVQEGRIVKWEVCHEYL